LRYTTDGGEPGPDTGLSGDLVSLSGDVELKAVALRSGWNPSPVRVGTYVLGSLPTEPVPGDNGTVNDTRPQLHWTPIQDAAEYRVALTDDTGTVVEEALVGDASFTPSVSLTDGESYSWRVKAVDADGLETEWSDTWHVTVDVTAEIEFDNRIDDGFGVALAASEDTVGLGTSVALTASADRAPDSVTWYVDGSARHTWQDQTSVAFTPPLAGVYAVAVVVRSGDALASDTLSLTVVDDMSAPGGFTVSDGGGSG
jgi:hypothetical protein